MRKVKPFNPYQIGQTATFLAYLKKTCATGHKKLTLHKLAKKMNIPYYSNIGSMIVKMGILNQQGRKGRYFYEWWATEPVTSSLAEKVLFELRGEVFSSRTPRPINNNQPTVPTISKDINRVDVISIGIPTGYLHSQLAIIEMSPEELLGEGYDKNCIYSFGKLV